jgi:TIR domain
VLGQNPEMSIFVSYRRDDAAGHAGRLCDDLADRLGEGRVFQDVDSIAPGEDFVDAIERGIAAADTVLAVIGPDWATVPNERGVARLSEPDDVVRMEIGAALRAGKPVIPVLVGGASMPNAGDLPSEIASLARRNAVEVRAESWDDDTAKLLRALGGRAARPAPTAPAARRTRRIMAGGMALAAVVVAAVLIFVLSDDDPQASSSNRGAPPSSVGGAASTSTPPAGSVPPLVLPAVARTILHLPSSEGLVATVDAASLAPGPDGVDATLDMTFENRDGYDKGLGPADVQLVADGRAVNPMQNLGVLVPARSVETMTFDFPLAGEPGELVVRVHQGDQMGEIPLTGPRAAPPAALDVVDSIAPADVGTVSFRFGTPEVEAYSDRHLVGIPIHATNTDRYDAAFTNSEYRLLVDGDPRAPVGFLYELIPAAASADATLWWEVPLGSQSLVLRIERQDAQVDRPVTPTA